MSRIELDEMAAQAFLNRTERLLTENQADRILLRTKAVLLYVLRRYEDSLAELSKIVKNEEGDPPVHFLMSDCYVHLGQYDLAHLEYHRGLMLSEDGVITEKYADLSNPSEDQLRDMERVLEIEVERFVTAAFSARS